MNQFFLSYGFEIPLWWEMKSEFDLEVFGDEIQDGSYRSSELNRKILEMRSKQVRVPISLKLYLIIPYC